MKKNILITGAIARKYIEKLRTNPSFHILYHPDCSVSTLKELITESDVIISRSETCIDKELIDLAPRLKVIARAAVGVSNIDIEYASQKGILVLNTPAKNTNSAAELTLGLLLAMTRNIPQAYNTLKSGGWDRHSFSGVELKEKKIGLIGLGNVGHRVAKFALGFDMKVYAYDPYINPSFFTKYNVIHYEKLIDMVKNVDFLSVHIPLNDTTKKIIDEKIFSNMKDGCYFLNLSRGGIVCEEALLKYLDTKKLKAVGIDTWQNEPNPNHLLAKHPKVFCSPHIGASTKEAQENIGKSVTEQVCKALEGSVVDHPVNLPQIGCIDNPIIKPFSVLAEKLGSIATQLITFNPDKITVQYVGDIANFDHSLIRLGFMKGYASNISDEYVSYVNAHSHFNKLGLNIEEHKETNLESYSSAIKIQISNKNGNIMTLGGTVFENKYVRFTLLNDFTFEINPSGTIIVIENNDTPGVIGKLGSTFAKNNINIESLTLSRKSQGGKAMGLIKIDSDAHTKIINELINIKDIISIYHFKL